MIDRFYLKQGDTARPLAVVLENSAGVAQDLASASVTFSMRLKGGAVKVNAASCTITNAATGSVEYRWALGDVDTVGLYEAEFVATLPGGKQLTFPASAKPSDYLQVIVQDDI